MGIGYEVKCLKCYYAKMRNKSSYGSIYFAKNAKTRIVIRKINNVLDEAIFIQYFQVLKAERRRL